MFEIFGMVMAWIIGAVGSFYIPFFLALRFHQGGLESIVVALWWGGSCAVAYIAISLIYFAAT